MAKRRNYKELGDVELAPDVAARANAAIEQAERELSQEVRVNFRWGAPQLALVRQAADLIGVPYQSYLKQAILQQAVRDIREISSSRDSECGDDQRQPLRLVTNKG